MLDLLIYLTLKYPSCIQESFNTNIQNQFFDYTITFVNSKHAHTHSTGYFVCLKGHNYIDSKCCLSIIVFLNDVKILTPSISSD